MVMSHARRNDAYKYNIAAVLYNPATNKILAKAKNDMPSCFQGHYSHDEHLGDSGTTIHAEIRVLSQCKEPTEGKALLVTDPLCPNCMKMVVAAGISRIMIYEKGLSKGYWYNSEDEKGVMRKRYFDEISLGFARAAGIEVVAINESAEPVDIILPKKQVEPHDHSIMHRVADHKLLADYTDEIKKQPHAMAVASDIDGVSYVVLAIEEYTKGMTEDLEVAIREKFDEPLKYRLKLDALSHILSFCAAKNLHLKNSPVYVSEIPTSRCIINAVGAGIGTFGLATTKAQSEKSRQALKALATLEAHGLAKTVKVSKIQQFLDI